MENSDTEEVCKIILVGDSMVGKSSIVQRYANNEFKLGYKSTVGVDFILRTIEIDGFTLHLRIWDTAGHEIFQSYNTGV